jgi:tRNA pseudouridine38-40 synthase
MRHFLTLAYRGTRYVGWQRQPNGVSVQATLEGAFSTLLGQPVEITGCGRTDAGVHARYFVAHCDLPLEFPASLLFGINSLLPPDIAVYTMTPVADDAHARYDALERRYAYHIGLRKDPFTTETAWFYPRAHRLDMEKMQAVASLLLNYEEFKPFCKTKSGLESFKCKLKTSQWEVDPIGRELVFHITANRFLRGMVRLIVGACVGAGLGRIAVESVRESLERQHPLARSLSVPARGLFLTGLRYPFPFEGTEP